MMAAKLSVLSLCLLFSIAGPLLACQARVREIDQKVLRVFSDFSFVGSGPAKLGQDGSIDLTELAPHGDSEQPKPRNLQTGVEYVFHHRSPVNNESLALRELPQKLSDLGFKVISAPRSDEGLMHLVYGGPLFRIEFSDGTHTGLILNSLHMDIGDGWTDHDYILFYKK